MAASLVRRVAAFDMGTVNYCAALIEHRPREERRKNMSAAKRDALPPPMTEHTQLVSALILNLKADAARAIYVRGATREEETLEVVDLADWPSYVHHRDLQARLVRMIGGWSPLYEVGPDGKLPAALIEVPGGGTYDEEKDMNNFVNFQLAYATRMAIIAADAALGLAHLDRDIEMKAAKAGVKRGPEESKGKAHKAASIKSMMECLQANDDKGALRFVSKLAVKGQKLDDLADAINMARRADTRTMAEFEALHPIPSPVKRKRPPPRKIVDVEEEVVTEEPPAKRPRHMELVPLEVVPASDNMITLL